MQLAARVRRQGRAAALLALVAAAASALPARAAEHITLRNGFELNCDHRGTPGPNETGETGSPGRGSSVRLFLDGSGTNYVDVAPSEIVQAETLPAALPISNPGTNPAATAPTARAGLSPTELHELLATAGAEHDLDVDLLASLVHAESGSQARAVSRAGAQGLMQLMPATAALLGVKDSFAPEANIHGGTAYLDGLLKRYHDNLALALAAYNAGPGAVDRYHGVPPYRETRAYVARIIHEFNQRYAARQAAAALVMAR